MAVFNVKSTPPSPAQEKAYAEGLAKLTLTYGLARRGDADAVARIASIRAAAAAGDARGQAAWRHLAALHTKAEQARARWQRSYGVAARALAGDPDALAHTRRVVRKAATGDPKAKAEADRIGCMVGKLGENFDNGQGLVVGYGSRRGLNGYEGIVVGKMGENFDNGQGLVVGYGSRRGLNGYEGIVVGRNGTRPNLVGRRGTSPALIGRSLTTAEHAQLMDLMQRAIDSIPNWRLFVQSGLGTTGSAQGSPKAGSFADAYLTSRGAVSNYTKSDGTINRNALMINRMF